VKASIVMITYNKNHQLPNVLHSIVRQKVDFPFEVCIVDDCSDVDPKSIVEKHLVGIDYKYKRLETHFGSMAVKSHALNLISPDSDVVVLQSADVIWMKESLLQMLCSNVKPSQFALATVRNVPAPLTNPKMYEDFKQGVRKVSAFWKRPNKGLLKDKRSMRVRSGPRVSQWYFFLGAIRRADLFSLDVMKSWCDVTFHFMLKDARFTPYFLSGIDGIHQEHPRTFFMCQFADTCKVEVCFTRNWTFEQRKLRKGG